MFTRITKRFTNKMLLDLNSNTLNNIVNWMYNCPATQKEMLQDISTGKTLKMKLHSGKAVLKHGAPNINTNFENKQGAWIFEHTTGIILVVFSDGHRANCYKGTAYELANLPSNFDDQLALQVYRDIKQIMSS